MSEDHDSDTPQYEPIPYRGNLGGIEERDPFITFHGNSAHILKSAYEILGEPSAIRFYLNNLSLGMQPLKSNHPTAYPVFESGEGGTRVSVGWVKYELDLDEELRGRAQLKYDKEAELWAVDLDEVLGQPKQQTDVTVDNVLSAMRLAGDWLENHGYHEPAADVGRAYNNVKKRRDEIRKSERQVADL